MLLAVSLIAWAVLFYRAGRERSRLLQALQPIQLDPAPAELELFLPDLGWIRPHLLVRKFSQGMWFAILFLCLWLGRVWDLLPQARRAAFRSAVAAVISGGKLEGCRVERPKLLYESPWEWAVSDSQGARHVIPKVNPGFTPVPGEAERAQSAPRVRWVNPAATALITAGCLAVGLFMGVQEEHRPEAPLPEPAVKAAPEETTSASTEAVVPEVIGEYLLNGLTLRTDDAFRATTSEFLDPEHGVYYQIELQFGVNEDAARVMLEKIEGGDARWLRPEGDGFLWRLGENGVAYQYNLRTVRLPDGRLSHTGAALSERGTMLILSRAHGDEIGEETARGTLLYMLENLQFTGPAITEENYQDQLRPAVSMG